MSGRRHTVSASVAFLSTLRTVAVTTVKVVKFVLLPVVFLLRLLRLLTSISLLLGLLLMGAGIVTIGGSGIQALPEITTALTVIVESLPWAAFLG